MASRPDDIRPVDARGTLSVVTPGGRSLSLVADGETLRLELPGWRDARTALPRSFRGRVRAARLLADHLTRLGLTLRLETSGRAVFSLGHDAQPTWLARLLRLGAADLPVSAVREFFRG